VFIEVFDMAAGLRISFGAALVATSAMCSPAFGQGMAPFTFKVRQPAPAPEDPAARAALTQARLALARARAAEEAARDARLRVRSEVNRLDSEIQLHSARQADDPRLENLRADRERKRASFERAEADEAVAGQAVHAAEATVASAEALLAKLEAAEAARKGSGADRKADAAATLERAMVDQCNRFFLYEPPRDGVEASRAAAIGQIKSVEEAQCALECADKDQPATLNCKTDEDHCRFSWLIQECTRRLDREAEETSKLDSGTVAHADLVRQYLSYIRLRRWAEATGLRDRQVLATSTPSHQVAARAAFDALDTRMPERLKKHNLMQLFSAVLVSGPMFGDTSEVAKTVNDKSADFGGMSTILWQSAHFGSEDGWRKWDFAIGGRFGIQPVLLMVKAEAPAETEPPAAGTTLVRRAAAEGEGDEEAEPEPEHQQALGYTMGLGVNRRIGEYSEVSISTRVGGSYLVAGPLLVDRGARDSYVALAADNGTGRTAWMWETGVDFSMFNAPITLLHIAKDLLSPQLSAGLAIRRDSRFKKDGDLLAFDAPEWRLVYRFMLDAVTVADRRQVGEDPKSFTFGFGVEYERALKGTASIPSATRFIVRGNVNLFKALKGGDTAETKETPPAGNGSTGNEKEGETK
jgi:hypothetical protein